VTARLARGVFLAALLAFSLVPFYWMLVASFKPGDEQLTIGNPWWFEGFEIRGYTGIFADSVFRDWMVNTLVVLVLTVLISIAASALAAYALAFLQVPHARSLVLVFFATYLVPQGVLFLPLVREMAKLHLLNSPAALVATFPSLVIPFGTWVLWSFFRSVPRELIDLAGLEGASSARALGRDPGADCGARAGGCRPVRGRYCLQRFPLLLHVDPEPAGHNVDGGHRAA
jgi:multiple sugar transport system permease protein